MTEEKKHHKNNPRKYGYWISGGIALIIIIFILIVFTGRVGIFVTPNCQQVPYEEQEEYMETEYYTESVPYTDQECENKQLVYSITNFENTGNCIDYDERCKDYFLGLCTEKEQYCVQKKVTSSLNLKNLDSERGNWVIQFSYSLDGQLISTENMAKSLYPQESGSTGVLWTINGEVNNKKDDRYSYQVINEPTKQVCRDVIKYREVQRERQVTAYRPVTKYKEVCD